MIDPERVLAALERLHRTLQVVYDRANLTDDHFIIFRTELDVIGLSDAIELIRGMILEPRRMLPEPPKVLPKIGVTNAKDGSWMWVEERQGVTWNLHHLEVLQVSRHPGEDYYVVFVTYQDLKIFECSEYGSTWRVWSKKPTDDERKAAPWL